MTILLANKQKNYNLVPLVIFIFGVVSLNIVQEWIRPHVHANGLLALLLYSYPNFIVGFSFPFSILLRPRSFSKKQFRWLFAVWCLGALVTQVCFEYKDPLPGVHTFDANDIVASITGALLAAVVYYGWLADKLLFWKEGDAKEIQRNQ